MNEEKTEGEALRVVAVRLAPTEIARIKETVGVQTASQAIVACVRQRIRESEAAK